MSRGEMPGSAKLPSMTSWLDVLCNALPPSGVLLVGAGAGDGQWVRWLRGRNFASEDVRVLLVEGDEQQYRHLRNSLPADAGWALRRDVVASSGGRATFYRASNPAESGLLKPESLQQLWAHLDTEESIVVEDAVTLDALAQEVTGRINWLILDCLPAAALLEGGAQLLRGLDVALLRVAQNLPSRLSADQQAADESLRAAGLRCVYIQDERHPALAHALYVRDVRLAQAELANAKAEKEEISNAANNLRKKLERLEADKTLLEQANAELVAQSAEREQLHRQAQDLLEQSRQDLAQAKKEEDQRRNVVNNLQRATEQLEADKAALEKVNAELTARVAERERLHNQEQALLDQCKRELAQVKEERDERSKVAHNRKKQIEQLEAAKTLLEQARNELGEQIAECERRHQREQGLLDQCRQELVRVKEEMEDRKKVASSRKKQIEQLEAEKAALLAQLAESERASQGRQEQAAQFEAQARQQALSVVAARWARAEGVAENWGDKLNPYLISKLSQKPVAHVDELVGWGRRPVYRVIGSGLGGMQPGEIYWGMGLIRRDVIPPRRAGQICAVRGPLSRHRLLEMEIDCPEVYGDPAVLLPLVFRPEKEPAHEFGVIQHFREAAAQLPVPKIEGCPAPKVIDIRGGIENVVKEILSCKAIISSSLHGVIAAHAYGRKAYWLKASDLPLGDDFKFHDYWASIGHAAYEPVLLDEEGHVVFRNSPSLPVPGFLDVDALLAACPFITKERCEQLINTRRRLAQLGARGTPFGA